MRLIVGAVSALSLLAGVAAEAGAKTYKRHAQRQSPHAAQSSVQRYRYPDAGGWYDHDANKLPIGSMRWWEQMRREGRLGGETP